MANAKLALFPFLASLIAVYPATARTLSHATAFDREAGRQFSREQLHNYALALLQIEKIKEALASEVTSMRPDARAGLEAQSNAQIAQILDRRELDVVTFNAISAQLERSRSLRQQVRQTMMQELIGF